MRTYFWPTFLFLLSLLTSIHGLDTDDCPNELPSGETCPPGPPQYFADPEECSNFWLCVGGCASNGKCQEDYLFDTVNGYCNHPEQVDCGDRPCTDPAHCPHVPETTTPIPATTTTTTTTTTTETTTITTTTTATTTITTTTTATTTTTTTTTTNAGPTSCPDQLPGGATCPPGPPHYYPDPEECSMFWLCVGGCASNGKCQEDYLFDTANGYCNHPEEVNCGDRPCNDPDHCVGTTPITTSTTPTTTTTTTATTTTTTTTTTTSTTSTVTTSTYTTTTTSTTTTTTTTTRTKTTTTTTLTTTPITSTTSDGTTGCPNTLPDGKTCPPGPPQYFEDPKECSKFWLCVGGCASNGFCQEDYLFDTVNGYCNHPEDVDCGERPCLDPEHCPPSPTPTPTPAPTPTPTPTPMPTPTASTTSCISTFPPHRDCPSSATKDFPDIDDCSKYWHCEGGCVTSVQCELNFLFDMGSSQCKEAAETDCSIGHRPCMDPQHCPCVNYDVHDDYLCQEDDYEEFFPDMTDCARYLNCSDGCFSSVLCPDNFLYNVEYQWCSYPHEIKCDDRPCLYPDRCGTQPQTTSTTQASSTDPASSTSTTPATTTEDCGHTEFCQDHLSMGLYADPFNCRKYWRCTNNGVGGEHYTCEDDKLFDLKYMGCNFPYLVDCQDRPICDDCDENCEYKTTAPPVEYCEVHQCRQDGFFCETKCSNAYCRCFGGVGFLQHCPPGQLWDCDEEACNFPCLVDEGACCPV